MQFITQTTGAGTARRRPHLATLVLASAISPLAINIFVPSMPSLAAHFGASYASVQLGLSLYLAATALLQLVIGPLSDFLGRRPVLLGGMALFIAGTVLTLVAPNVETFLAGRVVQSAAAAGIVLSRAVVRDLFAQERAASMIGYVTMGMAVAPMIGPAIGGVIDDLFGWRASFWLLLALGVIAFAALHVNLPETNTARGVPPRRQLRIYGELLGSARFWLFAMSATLATAVFFGFLGAGPAIASGPLALSPAAYGLWFALCALGYMIGNFVSGRCSERIGVRYMVFGGALITLAGPLATWLAYLAGQFGVAALFLPMLLVGIGNGMTIPNATAGAISVRPDAAGAASGLLGSIQIGIGALASIVAGILVTGANGIANYCLLLTLLGVAGAFFALLTLVSERR